MPKHPQMISQFRGRHQTTACLRRGVALHCILLHGERCHFLHERSKQLASRSRRKLYAGSAHAIGCTKG